ncbi:thiamine pyrophosphate-dependent enzyme [Draconibacterium sediminis]|uniref:Indolepyruvate oxidoreductase subunit IorA n=1 Tax=Draconibacterium sediminis TaxID=1544798 RepID=A0A0D8JB18_9BACT|nr:thiamine pyrophosphate-dependent enzyme [Draconibacterium sediminis]KJF43696.1 indolepyruvate ferredoxin oxidoreductase [Draconibacterium sediminis]
MQKNLFLGVEAIGQGAIDGGISGVYAYPGTPSTEITEFIQENELALQKGIRSKWSANEKTAYEAALGMSYAGKRSMVCMKHVGLNVAADAFINSAITGINGGLIVTVADDPSMHSSQNEQDSRFYGKFAMIPILEPSNQQEAYDMVREGFELSEKLEVPVMVRITTRLAHSRAGVVRSEVLPEKEVLLPADPSQFVLLPAIARRRYKGLLEKQELFEKTAKKSKYNEYIKGEDKSFGIIACGIAFNYLKENYPKGDCPYTVLKLSQYPVPQKYLDKMAKHCEEVLVLEEGYPVVEEHIKAAFKKDIQVSGRLSGALPRDGELNADLVAKALGKETQLGADVPDLVVNRPPALCQGCGHQDMYKALNQALDKYTKGRVFSDIGCYTLGALPPYKSIYSCVDMGASVTMAKGAADAGLIPSVAVIGDSTFTHSGITGLLDAVNDEANIVVVISDNESVSMTGGQESSALGKIESICAGVGVDPNHIRVLTPLKKYHDMMVQTFEEEIAYDGVSVIVFRRECIQAAAKRLRKEKKMKDNPNK